jgi:hypothetical protein
LYGGTDEVLCEFRMIGLVGTSVKKPSLDAPSFFGWHHGCTRT